MIGVSVSSRRRLAWLAGEFHAMRHARSDGCAREAALVVPANASADVRIIAIDNRRAMGETLARRRGDANVACPRVRECTLSDTLARRVPRLRRRSQQLSLKRVTGLLPHRPLSPITQGRLSRLRGTHRRFRETGQPSGASSLRSPQRLEHTSVRDDARDKPRAAGGRTGDECREAYKRDDDDDD